MAARPDPSAPVPPAAPRGAPGVATGPGGWSFTRGLWRIAGASVTCGNAVTLLDSQAALDAIVEAIDAAGATVDLEMYIIRADEAGRRMADALERAARRGVRVRVLADWLGSRAGLGIIRRLAEHRVVLRTFSPPGWRPWFGILPRDHRKVLVVDRAVGLTGGVNVGDEWDRRPGRRGAPWRDTAVRLIGPAVADLDAAFAQMWDRAAGDPRPRAQRRRERRLVTPARAADLPADSPPALVGIVQGEPGRFRIARALQFQAVAAERAIWIASAYFVPGGAELEALAGAARDGVDVRLLVPSTYDHPWIRRATRRRYRRLLENGVRIWEWRGAMMHAKTSVTDGRLVRVGSTDFNPLGLAINYELDAYILDHEVGAAAEAIFIADLAVSHEIRLGGKELREL